MTRLGVRDLLTPSAVVLAGLLVSSSIVWSSLRATASVATAPIAAAVAQVPPAAVASHSVDVSEVTTEGEPFIGDPKAPATMAYWFDYQCPYCRQEEKNMLPRLIADYVDAGKLRIIFKDFQFLGADSGTAALMGRAVWAANPEKFKEWHEAMFDHQDGENSGWGSKADILALTKSIAGIDEGKVEELLAKNSLIYQQAIDASLSEGNAMGVSGTPSFIVGKRFISGAVPYEQFRKLVDAALPPATSAMQSQ